MFLDKILQTKVKEVAEAKERRPIGDLERALEDAPPVRAFKESLKQNPGFAGVRLIAEIKKASPSKGLLCPNFNPVALASSYETSQAAAISVLTDEMYFQGSLAYLRMVKAATRMTPVLRKDFIIDPYQVMEARVAGADTVLLIVAALSPEELKNLLGMALQLGMTPLVEVHDGTELEIALNTGADIIGINNRDLRSFQVSLETTYRLLQAIPKETIVVAESGIHSREDIQNLARAGVHAVLIGEAIVTAPDPSAKIRELLGVAM